VYPIVFISIISTLLGLGFKLLYLKYLKKKILVFASLYLLLFIAVGYVFMCNWLVYTLKYATKTEKLSDIKIWDFSDNEIKLNEIENKVIVLDFWTRYCGISEKKLLYAVKVTQKEIITSNLYLPD
jgi:hypothetical protein